ncbi:phosphotransferase [Sinosporangium siamense]|uniref:Aminoglycoside phosphotransferase domain-containing protein n=1 Tax=Sinosporangium siamense TaxID=1367973 RepID=A0A919V8P4_9ACTN|nr:phosphotransferase [Sinosporangium siamense]GII93452.1 hypothetical protein Ssi02_36830 [Sinosporangium siamense]
MPDAAKRPTSKRLSGFPAALGEHSAFGELTASRLDELISAWAGQPVVQTPIKGGLSHRISRVDAEDGTRWLLRVLDPRVAEAALGIPLEQEIANTERAAAAGVGPQVIYRLPGLPVLLLEFLDGVTLDAAAVRDPELIPAIAAACRTLHAGPRFVNDFSIFDKLDRFLELCERHSLKIPGGYLDVLPAVRDLKETLTGHRLPSVPCHNDLLPQNLIAMSRTSVRIVDYQLSGNGDPGFELGDIAAEAEYDPDLTERLARAYFGAPDAGLTARVRLFLTMSNLAWTLWFSVHHGLLKEQAADADFDYEAEAAGKFARALRDLDDPAFGRLVDAIRRR